MKTTITEYSATAAALAELTKKYTKVVYPVETTAGMKQAVAARAELRGWRTDLETARKEIKAPALERCRLIDAEAKRIAEHIEALEEPIAAQIKAHEAAREQLRLEQAAAEARRISDIQDAIADFGRVAASAAGKSSEHISSMYQCTESATVNAEIYMEFTQQAIAAKCDALEVINRHLHAALVRESELRQHEAAKTELAAAQAAIQAQREAHQAELEAQRRQHEIELQAQRNSDEAARLKLEKDGKELLAAAEELRKIKKKEAEAAALAKRNEAFLANPPPMPDIIDALARCYLVDASVVKSWFDFYFVDNGELK